MVSEFIRFYDYLLLLPYTLFFFILARRFARKTSGSSREFYGLLISWWIKMIACVLYAWMIVYYYGYGDPMAYQARSDEVLNSISKNWENLKYVFLPVKAFRQYLSSQGYSSYQFLTFDFAYYTESTFMTSRVCCLLSFFSFNRFLITSFIFTNIAYYGFIKIYITLKKIIKGYNRELAIACLFIPSCIFWSSGLAKEPVCMICLGVIFSSSTSLFVQKKIGFFSIFNLLFCSYILCIVKSYIFYSFLAAFLSWQFYVRLKWLLSKSMLLRIYFVQFMVATILGMGYLFSSRVIGFLTENVGSIISTYTSEYGSMASVREGGGSFIKVNNIDFSSIGGILKFIPEGLITVFFRPFPWEISNLLMVLTVIENLFFILLLFNVIRKSHFFTRKLFINKNYQVFALIFTMLMAFMIAVSTFNFGSMVRYKMPFLPFWASFLLIINKKLTADKRVIHL